MFTTVRFAKIIKFWLENEGPLSLTIKNSFSQTDKAADDFIFVIWILSIHFETIKQSNKQIFLTQSKIYFQKNKPAKSKVLTHGDGVFLRGIIRGLPGIVWWIWHTLDAFIAVWISFPYLATIHMNDLKAFIWTKPVWFSCSLVSNFSSN